jgi:hypothetical protein
LETVVFWLTGVWIRVGSRIIVLRLSVLLAAGGTCCSDGAAVGRRPYVAGRAVLNHQGAQAGHAKYSGAFAVLRFVTVGRRGREADITRLDVQGDVEVCVGAVMDDKGKEPVAASVTHIDTHA